MTRRWAKKNRRFAGRRTIRAIYTPNGNAFRRDSPILGRVESFTKYALAKSHNLGGIMSRINCNLRRERLPVSVLLRAIGVSTPSLKAYPGTYRNGSPTGTIADLFQLSGVSVDVQMQIITLFYLISCNQTMPVLRTEYGNTLQRFSHLSQRLIRNERYA